MYYRGSAAAIIVYDITKEETFSTLKNWVRELRQHGPPSIVVAIAGNKCDLTDVREVMERDAKDYADSIHAIFVETSAKNAININELFIEIKHSRLPNGGSSYPSTVHLPTNCPQIEIHSSCKLEELLALVKNRSVLVQELVTSERLVTCGTMAVLWSSLWQVCFGVSIRPKNSIHGCQPAVWRQGLQTPKTAIGAKAKLLLTTQGPTLMKKQVVLGVAGGPVLASGSCIMPWSLLHAKRTQRSWLLGSLRRLQQASPLQTSGADSGVERDHITGC
ncbi:hypothetical protein NN561_010109 [Cricetulus griseus]